MREKMEIVAPRIPIEGASPGRSARSRYVSKERLCYSDMKLTQKLN